MKKFIFFIVALQIISSGHFMDELVKFDNLVDHFYEHKNSSQPLSAMEFIKFHYFDSNHEKSDPVRHATLPLRNAGISFTQVYHPPVESFHLAPLWQSDLFYIGMDHLGSYRAFQTSS
ncbi:MAG: hypothetical protein LW815_06225 [Chitinophagaceae bacterium]|nr:hypothetical protein [Chitinophagaceae bacterium]